MSGNCPLDEELTVKMLQPDCLQHVQLKGEFIAVPEVEAAGFEEAGKLVPGICDVDLDFPR